MATIALVSGDDAELNARLTNFTSLLEGYAPISVKLKYEFPIKSATQKLPPCVLAKLIAIERSSLRLGWSPAFFALRISHEGTETLLGPYSSSFECICDNCYCAETTHSVKMFVCEPTEEACEESQSSEHEVSM